MTINELREKRNQAWNAAKAFVETKRDKDGLLSDEDSATYAQMEKKVQDYGAEIERMEAMAAMEAQLSKPTSAPITEKPLNGKTTEDKQPKSFRATDAYRSGMLNALRTNFRQISNVLQGGIDANGGYLVPDEYDSRLIQVLNEENVMRSLGTAITTSGEHKINIAATKPAAAWIEEGGALTFGDATFDQIILDAHKLHVAVKVTEELLYDNAFNLENYILEQFGKALANAEEDAFINGNGTAKPTGLLHSVNGAATGVTTAGAAITADEIIDLIHSVKSGYRKKAVFLLNDSTVKNLRRLKDGNGQYLWQPGLKEGQPDKLLSYRLVTSAYMPEVASGAKPVLFGDFSSYWIADRQGRSFQRLNELYAATGQIGFRATQRVDGRLVQSEGLKCLAMKA